MKFKIRLYGIDDSGMSLAPLGAEGTPAPGKTRGIELKQTCVPKVRRRDQESGRNYAKGNGRNLYYSGLSSNSRVPLARVENTFLLPRVSPGASVPSAPNGAKDIANLQPVMDTDFELQLASGLKENDLVLVGSHSTIQVGMSATPKIVDPNSL